MDANVDAAYTQEPLPDIQYPKGSRTIRTKSPLRTRSSSRIRSLNSKRSVELNNNEDEDELSSSGIPKSSYFKTATDLSEEEQKFCRCVAHVETNPNINNPHAVCAKSTGTTSRKCGQEAEFSNWPTDELAAYLKRHNLPVPNPQDRQSMLNTLKQWKV